MNEQQRIDEACRHLRDAVHIEDRRSFWRRLLSSLRAKVTPGKSLRQPVESAEITGGTDF